MTYSPAKNVLRFFQSRRKMAVLCFDIAASGVSFWFSLFLRFEGNIPPAMTAHLFSILPLVLLVRLLCFFLFGVYRLLWKYIELRDLFAIVEAVSLGSLFLLASLFFMGALFFPRSVFFIDWMLLIGLLTGARVLLRFVPAHFKSKHPSLKVKKILIIGANDAGELLAREFSQRRELGCVPIGILDNDPEKKDMQIHGVKVLGGYAEIGGVLRSAQIDEVIIAASDVEIVDMQLIFNKCNDSRIPCRIVPRRNTFFSASLLPLELRRVDISDLLGRDLAVVDIEGIRAFFKGEKIMITGGGGSIGSELARVLARCQCEEIILVDSSENNLYEIEKDLQLIAAEQKISAHLTDVTDGPELEKIFQKHRPRIVFHAAANKQVPIVEKHYLQGIKNNVLGTRIVADLSVKYGVQRFLFISTDKAIQPRSIMGATKRAAELYLQSLGSGFTRFLTVRFGNVFNSRGSVIPLFRKQIAEMRAVTLTHPDVTRFFMDCTEAVFLILQAILLGKDSEIFILNMGRPVKIIDLARNLAKLMGVAPEELSIRYTGLRPGERLVELIELESETAQATSNSMIKIWKTNEKPPDDFNEGFNKLLDLVSRNAPQEEVLGELKKIVPEYRAWEASL
jgi:FlaA1/EpsC-like NDP-sugar epimerase